MCKVTTTTFLHMIAGWLYIYFQVDGPSGSGKEVKPSIPDPIPSQVLKSEYFEDISKVTSIFYAQNFYA